MATSSIYTAVQLRTEKQVERFINAVEKSEGLAALKPLQTVPHSVRFVQKGDIRKELGLK